MSKAIAGKKAAAFSAAFAIALSAGVVGADATVAHAQENGAQATVSNIDDSKPRSLTIHKYIGTESDVQGNGNELSADNPGIAGKDVAKNVDYRVELVQPLNSASDWEKAASIKDAGKATAWAGEGAYSKNVNTGDTGEVTLSDLPKGLYKVTETKVPDDSGLVIAKPFLVYVPMTDQGDNNQWIYDVHAYPKNTEVSVEKTVVDKHAHAGTDYTYTITSAVPAVAEGVESLEKYIVQDELDENLDADNAEVSVSFGSKKGETPLKETEDYTLTGSGQLIEVTFTDTGLGKIDETGKVFTDIKTKNKTGVHHIPNDATLITNNGGSEHDIKKNTDEVHTYWGKLELTKVDGNSGDKLQGAKFQLVQCEEQGEGNWKKIANTKPMAVGQDGATEWETDENGQVIIDGIHATDYADDKDDTETNYCLDETQAPKGYVANDELIHFTLNKGDVDEETGAPVNEIKATAEIKNYTDENRLPNTGGAGFIAIVLAGLAIIGGGFFAARRNSAKA